MNYTEHDVKCVKTVPCKRIIAGYEIAPTTGTPHIQGAIVFSRNIRRNAAREALGGRASLKKMKGTWAQQDYCIKEGKIVRMEDNSKQGQRTDLKRFYSDIMSGTDDLEVAQRNLGAFCKYQRAMSRLKELRDKRERKKYRNVEVIALIGKPGTGKTRRAAEEGAYIWSADDKEWWCGYEGEKVICIDEFNGQLPITRMNQLLEGYQCRLPIKGGHTYANWTKVYITSNDDIDMWYHHNIDSIKRRIDRIIRFN